MSPSHQRSVDAVGREEGADPASLAIDWDFQKLATLVPLANVVLVRWPGNQVTVRRRVVKTHNSLAASVFENRRINADAIVYQCSHDIA
jgi:hypothetical protein